MEVQITRIEDEKTKPSVEITFFEGNQTIVSTLSIEAYKTLANMPPLAENNSIVLKLDEATFTFVGLIGANPAAATLQILQGKINATLIISDWLRLSQAIKYFDVDIENAYCCRTL